jgi:hypothetical protein
LGIWLSYGPVETANLFPAILADFSVRLQHDTIKNYSQVNRESFDDSLEVFEAGNFGYTYELIGELVREGVIDLTIAVHSLRSLVRVRLG